MRRHRQACGAGNRRGSEPACDAADPFQIRHVAIRGASRDRLEEMPGAIDVFVRHARDTTDALARIFALATPADLAGVWIRGIRVQDAAGQGPR